MSTFHRSETPLPRNVVTPKRRYPNLITQRLLRAAIASRKTRGTGNHFVTEEDAALHSIVIVSSRLDIEVRLRLPGQLLGFAWLSMYSDVTKGFQLT